MLYNRPPYETFFGVVGSAGLAASAEYCTDCRGYRLMVEADHYQRWCAVARNICTRGVSNEAQIFPD